MKKALLHFGRTASLTVPFAALAAAYGLDRWHRGLAQAAAQDFDFLPALWGGLIANLVFGIVMVAAAWLMLVRRRHDRLVAAVYLLVGALVTLVPLSILLPDLSSLRIPGLPLVQPVRFSILDIGISSRVALGAVLLAILGVLGFSMPLRITRSST